MKPRARFKIEFTRDFKSQARTLLPENGKMKSGWRIDGQIHEDYSKWINEFKATHKDYGTVWGNFETVVYATSKKAYTQFVKDHPYTEWDYRDI